MKPNYRVVGAAIVKEGKVLALRRKNGIDSVIHKYEFVGGKVEEGETPEIALKRECLEELSLDIEVGSLVCSPVRHEYPEFSIELSIYFAKPLSEYKLNEHEEEKWIYFSDLKPEEWSPADRFILRAIRRGCIRINLAESDEDFCLISDLAERIMHETYDGITSAEQVDYMLGKFLSDRAIKDSIAHMQYKYKLIYLNGEIVGFFAYCPAKYFNSAYAHGRFLSKLYLVDFARGRGLATKVLSGLPHPVYLTVNRGNSRAIAVYKHLGFKITEIVSTDIGGGYFMDDFIMVLGK